MGWFPGTGNKDSFRLLGRQGKNRPTIRLADFRYQQGIYILYSNHGPYYTGLTTEQGLGKRLQDHLSDAHADKWDRFSWFGFKSVLTRAGNRGQTTFI
ncbi:GIY-YIG nuclease family protein [Salinisphaera sp. SWV1]|uniref:GIY-YIG nuclease family protein n=1 Tax=Salinisphaera sp. SWV1 TaxID=3454139 RepID=UPI003F8569FA